MKVEACVAKFNEAVSEKMKALNVDRLNAIRIVARQQPELHQQFLVATRNAATANA